MNNPEQRFQPQVTLKSRLYIFSKYNVIRRNFKFSKSLTASTLVKILKRLFEFSHLQVEPLVILRQGKYIFSSHLNYPKPPLPSRMLSLRLTMPEMDRGLYSLCPFSTPDQNIFFIEDIILIQFKTWLQLLKTFLTYQDKKIVLLFQDKFKTKMDKSRQTCKKSRFV